jgi:DNA-binding transcriptional regulator YhcF (GntR family)
VISLDGSDPTPPFEQIRRQLSDDIRTGALGSGHRLPSVRQLAGDLRIAAGTVARAYAELEAEGLVESSRRGTMVKQVDHIPVEVRESARVYIASLGGLGLDDAIRAVRVEWGSN